MDRPNLARAPFLDTRPVWLAGGLLAVVGVTLTLVSVWEVVNAHGEEQTQTRRLAALEARERSLRGEVEQENRLLAAVAWKKLQLETVSLEDVVARRRFAWSGLLSDLERVVPWDAHLTSIQPSQGQKGQVTVQLVGVAASRDAWLRLLQRLLTDDHFSDPVPQSEQAPAADNALGYKFAVQARYWPEGRQ